MNEIQEWTQEPLIPIPKIKEDEYNDEYVFAKARRKGFSFRNAAMQQLDAGEGILSQMHSSNDYEYYELTAERLEEIVNETFNNVHQYTGPGLTSQPFHIQLGDNWFRNGDVIAMT